jgi:hypothetical protein
VYPVPDAATFANLCTFVNDGRGVNGDAHFSNLAAAIYACRRAPTNRSQ